MMPTFLKSCLKFSQNIALINRNVSAITKAARKSNNYQKTRTFVISSARSDSFNVQSSEDFEERVLKSSIPVIVDFQAGWCGPCKILGPRLEILVESKKGKVHMAKVDIDEHSELAMEYEVAAVPTVLGVKDGKVVDRFLGVVDDDKINSFLDKLIGPT